MHVLRDTFFSKKRTHSKKRIRKLMSRKACCSVLRYVAGCWCVLQGIAAWNMSPRTHVTNSWHDLKNMVSVFVFWRRRAHLSHVAAFWRFCVLALIVPPEWICYEWVVWRIASSSRDNTRVVRDKTRHTWHHTSRIPPLLSRTYIRELTSNAE